MAEAKIPRSQNKRRQKKKSSQREVLKLCTTYLYHKDGCERGELCNNLHICRKYMLKQCRAGNTCTFSHDLQSPLTDVMMQRRYGLTLRGETRSKFLNLFAATIRPPIDKATTNESQESEATNKRLNEEKLMVFLESFSDIEEKATSAQPAKVVKKVLPVATPKRLPKKTKSKKATPSTDPKVSEKVSEGPSGEKAAKVTQEEKVTQDTVEGSQDSGEASSQTSSSAEQEPLGMPSSSGERLEICCPHLRGRCPSHDMKHRTYFHCVQPFQWQIQDARTKDKSWLDLSKQANSHLEKHFCDVMYKGYTGGILVCGEKTMHVVTIAFGKDSFTIQDGLNQVIDVRRLCTPSFARANGWRKEYSTQWVWYWKDGTKKWREYPKKVPVQAGNAASSNINSLTLERKYLDFKLKGKPHCYVFTKDEGQFQINFSCMEQTCLADHQVFEVARRPKYSTLERPTNSALSEADDDNESCASNLSADNYSDEPNPLAAQKKINKDAASVREVEERKNPTKEKQPREEKKEEEGPKVAGSGASQSVKPKAVGFKTRPPDVASFKGSEGNCSYQPVGVRNPQHLSKEPEAAVFMVKKPDVAMPKEPTDGALLSRDTSKLSENVFRGPHPSRIQDAVRPKETSKEQQLQEAKPKFSIDLFHLEATLDMIKDGGTLSPEKTTEVQAILKTLVANLKEDGTWTQVPYSLMLKIIAAQNLHLEQKPDTRKPKKEPSFSVPPLKEASAKKVSPKPKSPSPRLRPMAASFSSTDDDMQRTGYQTESVYICAHFLRGKCIFDADKYNHKRHFGQPYQWQTKDPRRQTGWQDLSHSENCNVEKIYCNVDRSLYSSCSNSYSDVTVRFDVSPMTGSTGLNTKVDVRRLSTVSSVTKTNWEKAFSIEWVWYWLDETQRWIVYSEQNLRGITAGIDSSSIEEKYLDYESKKGAAKINFTAGGQSYELDFKAMQQKNIRYLTCRQIRRRPKYVQMEERKQESKRHVAQEQGGSVLVPKTWDNPGARTDNVMINIRDFTSAEYINIANMFWDTMDDKATIVSIQRVQNLELWEDFTKMSERMKKRSKGRPVLQKQLFHGTQTKYVDAIISRQNFDWRLSGTTVGTLYGKGSYFARDASFSNSYTLPDSVDCRYVFLAQVLIGDTITGVSSYVRPPPKDPNDPHGELYDSCVNNMSDPEIFVVFEKTQVYPEYLIRYKLKSQNPASHAAPSYRTSSASSYIHQNFVSPRNPNTFQTSSTNRNTSATPSSASSVRYSPPPSPTRYSPPPRQSSPKKEASCSIQ